MKNLSKDLKKPLNSDTAASNKDPHGSGESSEGAHPEFPKTLKNLAERTTRFPKTLSTSTRRTVQFFRVTTIGLYFFVYSLYFVDVNPIKPYIKSLGEALGIDAQMSELVFSLPSLFALIAGVPANIFLTKFGQKTSMLLHLLISALGFGLRYFIEESFTYYIIGSIIIGIGLPFGMNMCLVVCAEWFDQKHVNFVFFIFLV